MNEITDASTKQYFMLFLAFLIHGEREKYAHKKLY